MKKKLFVALLTTILTLPLFIVKPFASTDRTVYTTTSYGNYIFTQGRQSDELFEFSVPFGGGVGGAVKLQFNNGSWMKHDYQFKDKYSGTIKYTVTSSQTWILQSSKVSWYCTADGEESTCYISATTSMSASGTTKTFTVIFTNATGLHFGVVAEGLAYINFFNADTGISISNFSVTSQPDETDIYTELHQLRLWWDLYVPGMSTNLSTIASNSTNIANDINTLKSYLDGLEGYTDQIEGYIDNIETYLNNLININKISTFELWQQNILFWVNSYSSVNFDTNMPYIQYLSSYHDSDYDVGHRFCVGPNSTHSLYFYSSASLSNANLFVYYRTGDPEITVTRTYSTLPALNMYMYRIDFINNSNSLTYFELEFDKTFFLYPIFYGNKLDTPDEVHYLFGDDLNNTYTRLLQSIDSGISSLNGSYDTSTYDSYEQTMDSLNDNMRTRFNNSSSSFQSNVNSILTPDQVSGGSNTIFQQFHFQAVNNIFTGFLSDLFTAFPLFQYLLIFGLLLLVLGVLI